MQIHVSLSAAHPLPPRLDLADVQRHLAAWYPDATIELARRWGADRCTVLVDLDPLDPRPAVLVAVQVECRILALLLSHWEVL